MCLWFVAPVIRLKNFKTLCKSPYGLSTMLVKQGLVKVLAPSSPFLLLGKNWISGGSHSSSACCCPHIQVDSTLSPAVPILSAFEDYLVPGDLSRFSLDLTGF